MKCKEKIGYGSKQVAVNAAQLHVWAYPACGGVDAYQCLYCGEWHIGHPSYRDRLACHLVERPQLHRPRHQPRKAS